MPLLVKHAFQTLQSQSRFHFQTHLSQWMFLRYATHNFYSQVNPSDTPSVIRCNDTKLINDTDENARGVDSQIDNLLTRLVGDVVLSNVGYSTLSEEGFYSLAQCWRDLTMD